MFFFFIISTWVLKKFSRNIGRLKLSVVTLYAKQLLLNLKHLKNCLFFTATYIKAWQHVEAILVLYVIVLFFLPDWFTNF